MQTLHLCMGKAVTCNHKECVSKLQRCVCSRISQSYRLIRAPEMGRLGLERLGERMNAQVNKGKDRKRAAKGQI